MSECRVAEGISNLKSLLETGSAVLQDSYPTGNQRYSGPHFLNENGIVACDGWSTETNGPPTYLMFLLMPNGAVLTAIGSGTPEPFRSALLGMQLTRACQTDSSNHTLSDPRPPPTSHVVPDQRP